MDGILLINKEKDYTSHDVVAIVKKALGKKVGHTGTLDPNATGILPVLVGNGTKLSKYLINHDKIYVATLQLGIKTDTADSTGKVIQEQAVEKLEKEQIEQVLQSMVGKQEQIPPMYSAIKVNGRKLYEYARNNQKVEVTPRQIEIYKVELKEYCEVEKQIVFEVSCSKGTYIRTLCEQIAEKLHTIGNMKELERIKVGDFLVKDAVTIQQVRENCQIPEWRKEHIITMEILLKNNPNLKLNDFKLRLFLNGVVLNISVLDGIYKIYDEKDRFIGTGIVINNQLKRDIILLSDQNF